MSRVQSVLLVALRTLIGWHFLYEGYFKLITPGWGPDGLPLSAWSSSGYLRAATGPFASLFHTIGASPWIGVVDQVVAVGLAAVGLGLMLGFFTQVACGRRHRAADLVLSLRRSRPVGFPKRAWRAPT